MNRAGTKAVVLLLAALPLLGAPCVKDKIVDVTVGFPATVTLEASGSTNVTSSSGDYDLKTEVDVPGALDDAGIDVFALDKDAIKVVQIFYRVTNPDVVGNRQVKGDLFVGRVDQSTGQVLGGGMGKVLVKGWSGNAGVGNVADPTAWVDITSLIDGNAGGLQLLNDYIYDCICFLQGTIPAMPNPYVRFAYTGTSTPTAQTTFFEYEVKIVFQGTFPQSYEVPFG